MSMHIANPSLYAQGNKDKEKTEKPKKKKKAKLPPEDLEDISIQMLANAQYNFSVSALRNASITNPTSLQFGPDGRLYVSQQNGIIKVFTVLRVGSNDYTVTATETISLINGIPNYNDDGTLATTVTTRQVTGILVVGTATNPVLYVGSSDSRIGGPTGDKNLDTNSGIISRLVKNGSAWDKTDLVRGLPRSEENHANNGMQLDEQTNTLYVASGGFTNAGSPSNNFAFICEYALAAAILSIDLDIINAMPTIGTGNNKYKYNLPTLDDPTRANTSNGSDPGDPFGGNDGLNQAKIVAGGPVQVYSPGYRNAYDLVITKTPGKARRMYTVDNGANQNWGGHPANEGAHGNVTNNYVSGEPGSSGPGPNDPQVNNLDNLHYIGNIDTYVRGSHYGGHPTPTRANPSGAGLYTHSGTGVWRTSKTGTNPLPADWPPLPSSMANPIEGDFQNAGETDRALLTFKSSTNGLTEYTASNFNGALKGHLLAAGYGGDIYKITLNDAGSDVLNLKGSRKTNEDLPFASGFGSRPLDLTSLGDDDVFPGTVWSATYGANAITIFEPQDFLTCTGDYNTSDEDGDGYTNADEIDNATNPCSASSKPQDSNGNNVSDLNDTDDDSDGIGDNTDYFALDANNGLTTNLPIKYDLFNNDPGTGLFGLGFTGLMSNKKIDNDYYEQFYEENLIAGGAVGAFSVVDVSAGDALGTSNNQENAFQFGVNVNSGTGPFTVQTRMLSAFFNEQTPQNYQSQGLYIGVGDQDNYLKIVLNANNGTPGIQVVYENAGVPVFTQHALGGLPSQTLDLYLSINPATGTVQPKYAKDGGSPVAVGSPIQVSGALLTAIQSTPALAVGIISTSREAQSFTATWDFIHIATDVVTATGQWRTIVPASGTPTARHEASYVQAGDKFYLLGGRGIKPVQIYNPANKTWSNGASTPIELHHFQAVTLDGLIYVVGAFTGGYPNETPVPNIYIYNPVTNTWKVGPQIPVNRRRGAAGAVVYNNKIYLVSGITNGHNSGHVTWVDEFNPATNTWTVLPDAPRARDHFHAAIVNGKLYAAAGRRSSASTGQTFSLTVGEVDVFDFATKKWSALPNNIPTKRAGNMAAVLGDELLIIGGESTQSTAHNQTEALNTKTNNWRTLSTMVQGRHGTQAIVSNNGIYVATGSGGQGGGPELTSQEAFYMFSPTTPTGSALAASTLTGTPNSVAMGQVAVGSSKSQTVTLSNTAGNQAILISSMTIADNSFTVSTPYTLPVVLAPGKSLNINVVFTPASQGIKSTSLQIQHSGTGQSTAIALSGEGVTASQPLYMINAGGPTVTTNGKTWSADQYFVGGEPYTNTAITDILNTTDDVLYKSERHAITKTFGYAFPVPSAGTYTVKLHFAEIWWGATGGGTGGTGKRVFDVNLEGGAVELASYDIYADVGTMKAVIKSFNIAVNDGTLNIDFASSVDRPKISAIEVIPYGTVTAPTLTANPTSLHFFSQQAGTTSAPQSVTLKNTGGSSLTISGVSITGTNSGEFAHNFSASTTIAAGASTTVNVTFTPASLGTKVAQLNISHTGSNSPLTVSLGGEGHDNPPSGQSVASLTLVNADTEQDIKTLVNGEELNLATLPTKNLNIRANTSPTTVGSVVFSLSGMQSKAATESIAPYVLFGDANGNYNAWTPAVGNYSLTATPYSSSGGSGTKGTALTLSFKVVNNTTTPTSCTATGTILREYWANVTGNLVSDIPLNTTPTSTSQLISFEAPSNIADNYGTRVRGYICAPATGSYTFYIAGDDNSELYLSTDENPATKTRIAHISGSGSWTGSKQWTKFDTQKSAVITLQAGKKYYIEALQKEGIGGDNLAVGWILPGSSSIAVISGSYLSPFVPTSTACTASGSILREYWANVTGTSVSAIPVGTTPTSTSQLTSFEAPSGIGDNYGTRVRGYICAPATGSYTFYIASDDNSELWLSTDDNPVNKVKIASITGWTYSKEWTKFTSQKSVAISLQAGKRYYIEALQKEGIGGDNLAVGWILPGSSSIAVIAGSYLSPVTNATARLSSEQGAESAGLRLKVYPNPSLGDQLQVEVSDLDAEEQVSFILYNSVGSVVMTKTGKADISGNLKQEIHFTSRLTSGMYTLVMQSDKRVLHEKITITK